MAYYVSEKEFIRVIIHQGGLNATEAAADLIQAGIPHNIFKVEVIQDNPE